MSNEPNGRVLNGNTLIGLSRQQQWGAIILLIAIVGAVLWRVLPDSSEIKAAVNEVNTTLGAHKDETHQDNQEYIAALKDNSKLLELQIKATEANTRALERWKQ